MFKKNKRLIAFILIFTISFTTYTMVQEKQAKAFVIADDILYIALGLLAVGTGAIAISKPQISDMGSRIFDKLTLDGIQDTIVHKAIDGTIQGIKITSKLKEIINSVVENLPNINIFDTSFSNEDISVDDWMNFGIGLPILNEGDQVKVFSAVSNMQSATYGMEFAGAYRSASFSGKKGSVINFYLKYYSDTKNVLVYEAIDPDGFNYGTTIMFIYDNTLSFTNVRLWTKNLLDISYLDKLQTIPYGNTSIKENYNPTYTEENLKENTYLPLPNDLSIYDDVSTELPLTWDNVKDLVNDIPLDNTTDIPGDTTTDIPGDTTTDIPGDTTTDIPSDGALDLDVPKVATLDFSPLYISLKDKFPFCIPFDLYNMVAGFNAPKVAPNFTITFPEETMVGGGSFDFNFDNYSKIVLIFRYFILLTFLVNLIKISRKLIGAE